MGRLEERNLLRTENLHLRDFNGFDINLTLSPGSRIGLLGDAGSGKTSLLRTLARLDPISQGKIYWKNYDVSRRSPRRVRSLRHHVSLLLSNPYTMFEPKTRISYYLRDVVKDAGSTIEKILQEKKLPIASPEQRISTLSGALHIQLALIRMQHNQSPVVLIDDVFRYLVPDVWNCVGDAIIAIVDGTQALVIASRYPECLKSMDTILVMHSGHFIEGGPRDEVLKFPAHPISRILIWNLNSGGESAVSEPITTVQHSQINDFVALTPGHWVLSNSKNPRVQ